MHEATLFTANNMLTAKNISFEYGNTKVLSGTSFSVSESEKIALVGQNGVGKSTLLKILGGIVAPSSGSVVLQKGHTIGYMPQEIDSYKDMSGAEFLAEITGVTEALCRLDLATTEYSKNQSPKNLAMYEAAYERADLLQAYTLNERIGKPLAQVGLDQAVLEAKISELSGGQKTRLALVAILLSNFDVLLLDEPTNNLDIDGLNILEGFIKESSSAFVIVSHDRRFIQNTCAKIAELLPDGQIKLYSLGYDEYIESRKKQREAALQAYEEYAEEKKRLEASARERAMNVRAADRRQASDSDKMGSDFRKEKAMRAHSKAAIATKSRLNQLKAPELLAKEIDLNIKFNLVNEKLPTTAVDVKDAELTFGNIVLGTYSLRVDTGQKIVIIGPNGGGKSSLMRLMAGEVRPSSGTVNVHSGIIIDYINQDFSFGDDTRSVIDNILEDSSADKSRNYSLLASFGIDKVKADSLPSQLSPGQRARALLAGAVAKGANLLLMDEPTNHLDIPASIELQNALNDFNGTLIVITHDRELIEGLDNKKIITIENGKILPITKSMI